MAEQVQKPVSRLFCFPVVVNRNKSLKACIKMSVVLSNTAVRLDLKRSFPAFLGVVLGWLRN